MKSTEKEINRSAYGRYAVYLIAAFIFSACSTLPEKQTRKSSASRQLLFALKSRNEKLQTFKGIGRITVWNKGKPRYARMMWMGMKQGPLRIEIFGAPGRRTVSFASDGRWITALSHSDRKFYKKRFNDDALEKVVSIPVKVTDIHAFLTGRAPIQTHHDAAVETSGSGAAPVLVLKNRRQSVLERIYFDKDGQAIQRVEMFDSDGFFVYRAEMERIKTVEAYQIPFKLMISDRKSPFFRLDIERYWVDVSVLPSAFVLEPPS